jgi:hypothetical protein
MNRIGEKGARSTEDFPSASNSAMHSPVMGAHRMPQQLWPAAMYSPLAVGTCAKGAIGFRV